MAAGMNFFLPHNGIGSGHLASTAIGLLCHYRYKSSNVVEVDQKEEIQESPMPPVIRSTDNSVIPIVPVAQKPDVRISLPLQPPRSPGGAYHPVGLVEP